MPAYTRLLNDWKSAEASAREAERELAIAWEQFERTRQEPPDPGLFDEVTRRRKLASERLADAMRSLNIPPSRG